MLFRSKPTFVNKNAMRASSLATVSLETVPAVQWAMSHAFAATQRGHCHVAAAFQAAMSPLAFGRSHLHPTPNRAALYHAAGYLDPFVIDAPAALPPRRERPCRAPAGRSPSSRPFAPSPPGEGGRGHRVVVPARGQPRQVEPQGAALRPCAQGVLRDRGVEVRERAEQVRLRGGAMPLGRQRARDAARRARLGAHEGDAAAARA